MEAGAGEQGGLGIGGEELALVVEHFFVMRDVPVAVHGVAVEAAAELVAEAAVGHGAEGFGGHFERPVGLAFVAFLGSPLVVDAEEEVQGGGAGEFGGAAEAALVVVEAAGEVVVGFAEDVGGIEVGLGGGAGVEVLLELGDGAGGAFEDFFAVLGPGAVEFFEEFFEADAAGHIGGGEVGAAEEGFQVGGEKDGHGPAAATGGGLDVGHVGEVHVRALFAVHFDGDEMRVEVGGDVVVLKGLALHDVAPVAGGVAGGEEDGLALGAGFGEGLLAPGQPGHRVVGVLQEVGGGLANQRVGGSVSGGSAHGGRAERERKGNVAALRGVASGGGLTVSVHRQGRARSSVKVWRLETLRVSGPRQRLTRAQGAGRREGSTPRWRSCA